MAKTGLGMGGFPFSPWMDLINKPAWCLFSFSLEPAESPHRSSLSYFSTPLQKLHIPHLRWDDSILPALDHEECVPDLHVHPGCLQDKEGFRHKDWEFPWRDEKQILWFKGEIVTRRDAFLMLCKGLWAFSTLQKLPESSYICRFNVSMSYLTHKCLLWKDMLPGNSFNMVQLIFLHF